jgi:uncharacterized protein (TIGR03437 family)
MTQNSNGRPPVERWTLSAYVAGDSNFSGNDLEDIQQIERPDRARDYKFGTMLQLVLRRFLGEVSRPLSAGWTIAILVFPFCAVFGQVVPLRYQVADAEFSRSLNRVVMVSSLPNQLTLYDPEAGKESNAVALPRVPTCVSISLDGRSAVVGYDGFVSVVDLTRPALVRTFAVSADVLDIVHGNGYAYVFPRRDQWTTIRTVRLSDGADLTASQFGRSIYAGTLGRMHPSGRKVYGANNGLSPSDIERYNIADNGILQYAYDSPYHGDYAMCGNLWPSRDGLRLITRCGNVFRSSDTQGQDMVYNGKLANVNWIVSADHAQATSRIFVLAADQQSGFGFNSGGATDLAVFEYDFLNPVFRFGLPIFPAGNRQARSFGRFVFASVDDSKAIVIVQADPAAGVLNDYGIAVMDVRNQVLNSASFVSSSVAPGQIVSLYGNRLADESLVPSVYPPPDTQLGRTAKVLDSEGVERVARMYFVSPDQINLLIPPDTALGRGRLLVDTPTDRIVTTDIAVSNVAPGLYTANGNGRGSAAALVIRVEAAGRFEAFTFQRDPNSSLFVDRPVEFGAAGSQVYLSLFGTGFARARSATARIGNVAVPIYSFGPQPEILGLDQVNIGPLPQQARGQANAQLVVTFDGQDTNGVSVTIR